MVELSVIMPVLFILALGTFEFGRALQHHHVIGKGVRDAARFLARVPATCPGGANGQGLGTITNATDITRAQNLALTGVTSGGTTVIDYWNSLATVAVDVDCRNDAGGTYRPATATLSIPKIRVTATVPYQDLGFLAILGLATPTFVVEHEQMHIGA